MITLYRFCWCSKILVTQDSKIENLFCGASYSSEPSVFLVIISFAWGLSLFKVTLECVIISDWVRDVSQTPVLQILLQFSVKTSIMDYSPAWTNSAGILSIPLVYYQLRKLLRFRCNRNFLKKDWSYIFILGLIAVQKCIATITLSGVWFWAIFHPFAENYDHYNHSFIVRIQ